MLPRIERIDDIIASDTWGYQTQEGETAFARIEVGRPQPIPGNPNGDWYCPVFIEGFNKHIAPIAGVGPVDDLLNAMTLVQKFADRIGDYWPRAIDHD